MGTVPHDLAAALRERLGLGRAIETGTFRGVGTRSLATVFDSVISIELAEQLYIAARLVLQDLPNVLLICGDSRVELDKLIDEGLPTFYFLDGHWSGGQTAGQENECPLLTELAVISRGHADDCVVIDDVRLLAAPPPPPHKPRQWPSLMEVWDAIRVSLPEHYITIVGDQLIAAPMAARAVVDAYGIRLRDASMEQPTPVVGGRWARRFRRRS